MSKFIFTVRESYLSKFEVEETCPENAVELFINGGGSLIDNSLEFVERDHIHGHRGIIEMFDEEENITYDSDGVFELEHRKTLRGEKLYTLAEAKKLLGLDKTENDTQNIDNSNEPRKLEEDESQEEKVQE